MLSIREITLSMDGPQIDANPLVQCGKRQLHERRIGRGALVGIDAKSS
jgi:hypothetical protein